MKLLIIGATGLVGKALTEKFKDKHQIIIVSRDIIKAQRIFGEDLSYIAWDYKTVSQSIANMFTLADGVINLAGANISEKRWNHKFKSEIKKSRVETTKILIENLILSGKKYEFYLNASAVGIYGSYIDDRILSETSSLGNDFLADVCKEWESMAQMSKEVFNRHIILRLGVIFSTKGGALPKMLLPFKMLIGGKIGSGKQYISWIHIDDLTNLVEYMLNNEISGVFNATSPNPVTMEEFTATTAKVLKRPKAFTVPEMLLKLVLGEQSSIILKGQRAIPQKIEEIGFHFQYPSLEEALRNLLKR